MISEGVVLSCSCIGNICTVFSLIWYKQKVRHTKNAILTVDTMTKSKCLSKKGQRVACDPKVKIFKLHKLWASSRNLASTI